MWIIIMLDEGYTPPRKTIIDVIDTYQHLLQYINKIYDREPLLRLRQSPLETTPLKVETIIGVDIYHKYIVVQAEFTNV